MTPVPERDEHETDLRALTAAVTELKIASATLAMAVKTLTDNYNLMSEVFARKDIMEPRVRSLEKTREWAAYLIVGTVILALLSLVVVKGGALG